MDKKTIQDVQSFDSFFKNLIDSTEKSVSNVQNIWKKKLSDEFFELNNLCQDHFRIIKEKDFSKADLTNELENLIKNLINWNEDFISEKNDLFILNEFIKNIEEIIEKLENDCTYLLTEKYYQVHPVDNTFTKIWKVHRKIRFWIRNKSFLINNNLRKVFKKPAKRLKQFHRSFQLHLFLKYYFLPAVIDKVQSDWYDLQKQIVHLFDCRQMALETVFSDIFTTKNILKLFLSKDNNQSSSFLKNLLFDSSELDECQNMLNGFLSDYDTKNKEFFEKLEEDLLYKWNYAGTFIIPKWKFSKKLVKTKLSNIIRENNIYDAGWQNLLQKEAQNRKKDLELFQLQIQTLKICIQNTEKFKIKIVNDIIPSFTESYNIIFDSFNRFKKLNPKNKEDLKNKILAENKTVIQKFRKELLPISMDAILKAELIKNLNSYHSFIRYTIDNLSDEHCIVKWRDWDTKDAKVNYDYVALEDIILDEIFIDFSRKHNAFVEKTDQQVNEITRHISEIDQMVEFNIESALEFLEGSDENSQQKAAQAVHEGLERSSEQLNEIINKIQTIYKRIQKFLPHNTLLLNRSIQKLADNEKIIKLRLRITKVKTRQKIKNFLDHSISRSKNAYFISLKYLIKLTERVKSKILTIRKATGLLSSDLDLEKELSIFLTNTTQQIEKLPYVYRRLFKIEPLEEEHFFEGRKDDLGLIKNEFSLWQKGYYGVTALVGEKGSGKTSLLNYAKKEFLYRYKVKHLFISHQKIYTEERLLSFFKEIFTQDKFDSLDELEAILNENSTGFVVIIEDIQNLFLRTVDGFEALERFLLLISRTSKNVFWLLTCSKYSWLYLNRVLNIAKFFQTTINIGSVRPEDIEKIILKRHRVSGYKIKFEPLQEQLNSKRYKKLATEQDQQEYLSKIYFEQLNNLAAGNISVAMKFWMSAVKQMDKDALIISLDNFDTSFLARLPEEEIFTLASLIQHEMLLTEEHSAIFDGALNKSVMLLTRMHNRGLLTRNEQDYYQVNFLLYRAIVKALMIRNIIY